MGRDRLDEIADLDLDVLEFLSVNLFALHLGDLGYPGAPCIEIRLGDDSTAGRQL
jgi:hypothetical protein